MVTSTRHVDKDLDFQVRGADDDGEGGMSWGWWCGAAMVVSRVACVGGSGGGGVVRGGAWVEDQIDRVTRNVSGLGRKTRRKSFLAVVGRKRWRPKVGGGRIMREKWESEDILRNDVPRIKFNQMRGARGRAYAIDGGIWILLVYLEVHMMMKMWVQRLNIKNLETTLNSFPISTTRIHKDHPKDQIIGDINSAIETRRMINFSKENAMVHMLYQKGCEECPSYMILLKRRDTPFDLEAFFDSDSARVSLDRKSTTGGCPFLGKEIPYEKKLVQVIKIQTNHNVHDLLIKAFDVSRRQETMGFSCPDKVMRECLNSQHHETTTPKGHISGSGEGKMAHTFELMDIVPPTPHDSPLPGGYTPGSDKEKDAQAVEILNLKKRGRESDKTKPMFKDSDFDGLDDDMPLDKQRTRPSIYQDQTSVVGSTDTKQEQRRLTTPPSSQLSDTRDKGKGIMVEHPPMKIKRSDQGDLQLQADAELAQLLHQEELAQVERRQRERAAKEEAFIAALYEEYDTIQANIDANALFAARL
ncbi:hypothetical protein Tco_1541944 [Tanacetum coccineum]